MVKRSVVFALVFLTYAPAKADMSENMCQSYMAVVNQALGLRQQGVPIDIARRQADGALSLSRELWLFLNKAINSAYKEPDRISAMLADGTLVQMCASEVRGY
jgi:hypothetical protein